MDRSIKVIIILILTAIIVGTSLGVYLKQNEQQPKIPQPKIPQTKLSVELQQTKERYEKWEKEQAIKDTITELRVKMGEIEESFEDWHARSKRDLDRFVNRQVRGN